MSPVGCAECRQCEQILSLMEFSCCEDVVLKFIGYRFDAVNCFLFAVILQMFAVGCAECRQCEQILSLMEFSCCEDFVLKCNGCRDDAVNCFPSAVMFGARGHGLRMPVAVAKHLELRTQHQAMRGVLHCMAERM